MHHHFTPRRPWSPLTEAEWAVLEPYVAPDSRPGPRVGNLRGRFEAVLHNAVSGEPWRAVPEGFGRADTVSRQFRRWAQSGVFARLMEAVVARGAPSALRRMEYWVCRLARRAMRVMGMRGILLARRLGLWTALPMVPWLMPNPELSEAVFAHADRVLARIPERWPGRGVLRMLGRVMGIAGGRAVWSRKFAAP